MDSVAWDQRYRQRELVWTSEPNRFLVSETQSLTPGRAIDLACGEGRNAVWRSAYGPSLARRWVSGRRISALWRIACRLPADDPDAVVAASVPARLDRHAEYLASDPPRRGPRVPGSHLIFVAAAVARTPDLPAPMDSASAAARTGGLRNMWSTA
jgi:hypothetical protein